MKTLILRLLLLAAGIFCLGCTSPTHGKDGDKEKIKILREALENASEKSASITIGAAFDEAGNLIQNLKPQEIGLDPDQNLRFRYADKWFVHKNDGAGKETSHILYGKIKVVLFDPDAKDKKK